MSSKLRKILSLVLTASLLFQQVGFAQIATELNLASHLSHMTSSLMVEKFRPLHLRYFSYDASKDNFKVLVDKGDWNRGQSPAGTVPDSKLQSETKTLLKYFLVGITLPDSMFWVNLRPDSEDQIIDQYLEKTDIGKIMLEADLQLKKDTASMTSPSTPEGKIYWDKLYRKAAELYGYDNVTIPTLTRPWIVPGEIIVRENQDSAYVYKANLKVMLEQDYLKDSTTYQFKDQRSKELNEYSSELIRELIIPKLTREVNSSKRYAPLRQVYYSLILSRWFKLRFTGKQGAYASLINRKNLTNLISQEPWSKTTYFNQYKKSFTDGEYNLKTQVYTPTGQAIRSYFSGGAAFQNIQLPGYSIPKGSAASPVNYKKAGLIMFAGLATLGGILFTTPKISAEQIGRPSIIQPPVSKGGAPTVLETGPQKVLPSPVFKVEPQPKLKENPPEIFKLNPPTVLPSPKPKNDSSSSPVDASSPAVIDVTEAVLSGKDSLLKGDTLIISLNGGREQEAVTTMIKNDSGSPKLFEISFIKDGAYLPVIKYEAELLQYIENVGARVTREVSSGQTKTASSPVTADFETLKQTLESPDAKVRKDAVDGLGKILTQEAADLLFTKIKTEPDTTVFWRMDTVLDSLIKKGILPSENLFNDTKELNKFAEGLDSEDVHISFTTAVVLKFYLTDEAVKILDSKIYPQQKKYHYIQGRMVDSKETLAYVYLPKVKAIKASSSPAFVQRVINKLFASGGQAQIETTEKAKQDLLGLMKLQASLGASRLNDSAEFRNTSNIKGLRKYLQKFLKQIQGEIKTHSRDWVMLNSRKLSLSAAEQVRLESLNNVIANKEKIKGIVEEFIAKQLPKYEGISEPVASLAIREAEENIRQTAVKILPTINKDIAELIGLTREEAGKRFPENKFVKIGFDPENRLGWTLPRLKEILNNPEMLDPTFEVAQYLRDNFKYIIFSGMGGSGLSMQVVKTTFDSAEGPRLDSLRTTDAGVIKEIIDSIVEAEGKDVKAALKKIAFVSTTKSFTTAETLSHQEYMEKLFAKYDVRPSKGQFTIYTDPTSDAGKLKKQEAARQKGYDVRYIQLNSGTDVGGRFTSPNTNVFLLPLAIRKSRQDVIKILKRAVEINDIVDPENDVFGRLGVYLDYMDRNLGKDKVTFLVPPELRDIPVWSEQLLEESLGKDGKGISVVYGEQLNMKELRPAAESDRVFLRINIGGRETNKEFFEQIKAAGYPVFNINLDGINDIAGLMLGLERATATYAYQQDINFTTQPGVEGYKEGVREVLANIGEGGKVKVPAMAHGIFRSLKVYYQPFIDAGIATKEEIKTEISKLGSDINNGAAVYAALINIALRKAEENPEKFGGFELAEIATYGRMNKEFRDVMEGARFKIFTSGLKMASKLGEGPDKNHSYQQMVAQGKNYHFSTYLKALRTEQSQYAEYDTNVNDAIPLGTTSSLVKVGRKVVLITMDGTVKESANVVRDFFAEVGKYIDYSSSTTSAARASSPIKTVIASDESVFEIPDDFIGVKFGTSGHRGENGKQLNPGIAAAIAQGIVGFVNQYEGFKGKDKVIIIGGDPRSFNKAFQEEETRVALANGFKVLVFDKPMPTPIGSFVIRYANEIFELSENEAVVGTINNTPSHNPRHDGGIKLNPGGEFEGAPSEPNVNDVIQDIANGIIENGKGITRLPDSVDFSKLPNYTTIDQQKVFDVYIRHLEKLIDFNKIRKAIKEKGLTWNVSTQNGAAGWWMRKAFEAVDKNFFTLFHKEPLPDFGDLPLGPNTEKIEKQKEYFKDFFEKPSDGKGATDGDGDRFYLADENGNKVNFNVVLALVFDYLRNRKGIDGAFLTCVDGTGMFEKIGKVAPRTRIGFKEFQYALKDKRQNIILAGEGGSGGLTLGGHVLDKDGIAAQLIFVEMTADAKLRGLKISDLIKELYKKYGYFVMLDTRSIPINSDVKTAEEVKKMVPQMLAERYKVGDEIFPGYKIDSINTIDGLKFFLKEEGTGVIHSMLIRPSGTGKEMRDYTEGVSLESVEDGLRIANAVAKMEDGLVNQLINEAITTIKSASSAVQSSPFSSLNLRDLGEVLLAYVVETGQPGISGNTTAYSCSFGRLDSKLLDTPIRLTTEYVPERKYTRATFLLDKSSVERIIPGDWRHKTFESTMNALADVIEKEEKIEQLKQEIARIWVDINRISEDAGINVSNIDGLNDLIQSGKLTAAQLKSVKQVLDLRNRAAKITVELNNAEEQIGLRKSLSAARSTASSAVAGATEWMDEAIKGSEKKLESLRASLSKAQSDYNIAFAGYQRATDQFSYDEWRRKANIAKQKVEQLKQQMETIEKRIEELRIERLAAVLAELAQRGDVSFNPLIEGNFGVTYAEGASRDGVSDLLTKISLLKKAIQAAGKQDLAAKIFSFPQGTSADEISKSISAWLGLSEGSASSAVEASLFVFNGNFGFPSILYGDNHDGVIKLEVSRGRAHLSDFSTTQAQNGIIKEIFALDSVNNQVYVFNGHFGFPSILYGDNHDGVINLKVPKGVGLSNLSITYDHYGVVNNIFALDSVNNRVYVFDGHFGTPNILYGKDGVMNLKAPKGVRFIDFSVTHDRYGNIKNIFALDSVNNRVYVFDGHFGTPNILYGKDGVMNLKLPKGVHLINLSIAHDRNWSKEDIFALDSVNNQVYVFKGHSYSDTPNILDRIVKLNSPKGVHPSNLAITYDHHGTVNNIFILNSIDSKEAQSVAKVANKSRNASSAVEADLEKQLVRLRELYVQNEEKISLTRKRIEYSKLHKSLQGPGEMYFLELNLIKLIEENVATNRSIQGLSENLQGLKEKAAKLSPGSAAKMNEAAASPAVEGSNIGRAVKLIRETLPDIFTQNTGGFPLMITIAYNSTLGDKVTSSAEVEVGKMLDDDKAGMILHIEHGPQASAKALIGSVLLSLSSQPRVQAAFRAEIEKQAPELLNSPSLESASPAVFNTGYEITMQDLLTQAEIKPLFKISNDYIMTNKSGEIYKKALLAFIKQLKDLPFNNEQGKSLLVREDAKEVLQKLIGYIERKINYFEKTGQWDWSDKNIEEIRSLFEPSKLMVFATYIDSENEEGISYKVNLGISELRDYLLRLDRYMVKQGKSDDELISRTEIHFNFGDFTTEGGGLIISLPISLFPMKLVVDKSQKASSAIDDKITQNASPAVETEVGRITKELERIDNEINRLNRECWGLEIDSARRLEWSSENIGWILSKVKTNDAVQEINIERIGKLQVQKKELKGRLKVLTNDITDEIATSSAVQVTSIKKLSSDSVVVELSDGTVIQGHGAKEFTNDWNNQAQEKTGIQAITRETVLPSNYIEFFSGGVYLGSTSIGFNVTSISEGLERILSAASQKKRGGAASSAVQASKATSLDDVTDALFLDTDGLPALTTRYIDSVLEGKQPSEYKAVFSFPAFGLAIDGLGPCTSISIRYERRYGNDISYQVSFWFQSTEPSKLIRIYTSLTKKPSFMIESDLSPDIISREGALGLRNKFMQALEAIKNMDSKAASSAVNLVKLKNGTVESEAFVKETILSFKKLMENIKGMIFLNELVRKARDPQLKFLRSDTEEELRKLNLVLDDGSILDSIRNIALSAVEGHGLEVKLVSPIHTYSLRELTPSLAVEQNRLQKEFVDILAEESSSPVKTNPNDGKDVGGIDFRALPMVIQPMGSFKGLNFKLPQLTQKQLAQINIDSELGQIQNMIKSGMLPSGERVKELVAVCAQKKELSARADNLLLCLIDICKLEEENAFESSKELREALVIVDSVA